MGVGRVLGRIITAIMTALSCVMALTATAAPAHAGQSAPTLYVTNRSSNNVAAFTIGPTGLPAANPATNSTGAEPRGIVFTPDGTSAYIVDTGANSISAYSVDPDGGLRLLSTPSTKGRAPFGIAIAPNGRSLYVSNSDSGTLVAFAVDADGTLSRLGPPVHDPTADPRGLTVSADGRFLFVGHGGPDASLTDVVTTFAIAGDGGIDRVAATTPAGGAGSGMAVSPDGRFLYVVCISADAVFGYRIGPAGDLDPLPGSPFAVADFPEGAAITADGRYLYVTSPGPDSANPGRSISAFTLGADGVLTPISGSPFTAGNAPVGVAATPDSRRLYVANFDDGTISAFAIQPTGALREILGSPVPSGGDEPAFQALAVRPTGP